MADDANADVSTQFEEFRRLNRRKVECLEAADPEYLQMMWYYPIYKSIDLFVEKYPDHESRVAVIEQLQDNAVQFARGLEQAELDVAGMSISELNP